MLFAWIDEMQRRNGIAGDIFEIGCHHGKSSALLKGCQAFIARLGGDGRQIDIDFAGHSTTGSRKSRCR